MRYDYLTPKFTQTNTQPAEIQTPNSQGTELNQSVQQNNQVMQPALSQPSTQQTIQPTTQPSQNNIIQRDTKDQVQPNTQQNQQIQPVQSTVSQPTIVQPSGSSIAVRQAADFNDATVQSYWNEYQNGVNINDYQAQINALTAIDNYRATKGLSPIYTSNIYELTNQRTRKIENAVKDYENDIAIAYNSGDYDMAQQIGQQLEDYKKMVNYQPTIDNAATFLQDVEYRSNWDNAINNIVQQLLTAQFTYNPSDDQALMKAQQYASNVVYESMNSKGILDSTMTAQMVTKTVNDLIPVYQKMAKEEFYENIERLQTMANFIIKLDDRDYSRWQDEVTLQLQRYEAKKKAISDEWDRVNTMGYVDNTASILLGVPVGTLSPSKRQAIDEAKAEIEKETRKLQSDITLAEAKAQIDYQYGMQEYGDKKAIDYQYDIAEYGEKKAIDYQYDKGLAAFKAGLKNSSGSSSGNAGLKLGIGQGTKYEGTSANIKKTIKNNYDKNGDLSKAIEDIYANYPKSADREVAFEDILGMSEEEALESYDDSNVSNVISTLEEEYGSISKNNREQLEAAIIYLTDSQAISKDIAENALEEIDYEINYQDELKKYQDIQNKEVDLINNTKNVLWINTLKNAMDKSKLEKVSEDAEKSKDILVERLGNTKYEKLLEELKNKDDEISKMLKKRGIDW